MTTVDDGTEVLRRRLEPLRASWIEYFTSAIADARERGPLHVEPAMRDGDGNVVQEGPLATGLRPDFVQEVDGAPDGLYVDAPMVEGQVTYGFELNSSVACEVFPFRWQDFRVRLMPADGLDLAPLSAWFWEWFDANDLNDVDGDGFFGVVHWLGEPVAGETGVMVDVDLGSAPVDAFLALLDAVSKAGATRLVIWSPQHEGDDPLAIVSDTGELPPWDASDTADGDAVSDPDSNAT